MNYVTETYNHSKRTTIAPPWSSGFTRIKSCVPKV